jgi:hypothetical protein
MSYVSSVQSLWAYVIIISDVPTQEFTATIDQHSAEVANWMSVLPNTIFVVSPLSARDLGAFLRRTFPGRLSRFLILDADTDRAGWLPKNAWEFLAHPKPA